MKRLDTLRQLSCGYASVADIGCDHAKLCKLLLDTTNCTVFATDISPKSLKKAEALLKPYGARASCAWGDGLKPLTTKVEALVIAGMGGREICKILLEGSAYLQAYQPALILSPQTDVPLLRQHLVQNGYYIDKDFCLQEDGIFYDIIVAHAGTEVLDDLQLRWGKTNLVCANNDFVQKLDFLHDQYTQKMLLTPHPDLQKKLGEVEQIMCKIGHKKS